MLDWDTRIKNLKTDIEIARQKYVVPFTKAETKAPPVSKEANQTPLPTAPSLDNNVQSSSEKLYENKDPVSSLDLINKTNEISSGSSVGLTEEITNKIDKKLETDSTEPTPTIDIEEAVASAEPTPTIDIEEAAASAEPTPTIDIEEAVASEELNNSEEIKEKTELELLEERDENDLSEEEEDRMYELRLLRAQKNMNNEVRETEEVELKKADDEIAHLKTLLKPKPKKLPKGYIA
ncbi:hypothetical protein N9E51_00255 [Alphaproteobacteria bacterium]|nr:hypothetical protein [Alphaproteobacteria bacterium]